jgi:hypothetical protein
VADETILQSAFVFYMSEEEFIAADINLAKAETYLSEECQPNYDNAVTAANAADSAAASAHSALATA